MTLKDIKIFSQNVHKNNFIINTILETQSFFNIIFIQELSWSFIYTIPSLKNKEGKEFVEVPNHPNWMTFSTNSSQINNSSRVIMLQLRPLVLNRRRTLYRVYTRELNKELSTRLSTLYTTT